MCQKLYIQMMEHSVTHEIYGQLPEMLLIFMLTKTDKNKFVDANIDFCNLDDFFPRNVCI